MTDEGKDYVGILCVCGIFLTACCGILADCAKTDVTDTTRCITKACASGSPVPAQGGRCICVTGEAK